MPFSRAATSQKCVRAGGKHNDLEEVGRTARHHTFFEMLGNFSFGDYFKREAIGYAWEFLTVEMALDPGRLFATVHHTDDEAAGLWTEVAGVAPERIYRLGDKDNFWQMADTGPCGPCSEIHYDLRPRGEWGVVPGKEEFERRGEAGEFLELWNLVFMQFEAGRVRRADAVAGSEHRHRVGAGAARRRDAESGQQLSHGSVRAVAGRGGRGGGAAVRRGGETGVSYRVLADHARAVAFLVGDGVFPSNEGRGYVLRRILRRGVRHAWLLGRREPTLTEVVGRVIDLMEGAYPELGVGRETRAGDGAGGGGAVPGDDRRGNGEVGGGCSPSGPGGFAAAAALGG